jgi:hypothetical protein
MFYRKNTQEAFSWLITILQKHHIPYQISGGFAAKIYGAKRPLLDIDIDLPEERFDELLTDIGPYLIYGPKMWRGEGFKVYLMTLDYHGQAIDIGGSHLTQIWHRKKHAWVPLKTHLTHFTWKYLLHHRVKVIPKDELISYKSALNRRVDKKDLKDLVQS